MKTDSNITAPSDASRAAPHQTLPAWLLLALGAVLTSLSTAAFAVHDEAVGADACAKTTDAAFKACQSEVLDDYWIAIGNCANLADADAAEVCQGGAMVSRDEADDTCHAQSEARAQVCAALGGDPYDPVIDPENFLDSAAIAANPNPYFPLVPGSVRRYQSEDEEITVTVTEDTKAILGVTTIVVRDVVTEDGEVIEDTLDWYAQDMDGNVWYFGELARNFEDGELVDLEGSWTAGVDGAKPGVIMWSAPQVGSVYRQEFALGDAEDMGEVVSTTVTLSIPTATCMADCVVTRDYTPLEPDVNELKAYAPGIGLIGELDLQSGDIVQLVEVIAP